MSTSIVDHIADRIVSRLRQSSQAATGELRLIFHGPPIEILQETYERVCAKAADVLKSRRVPTLLQVTNHPTSVPNPPVGESGKCDANYLLVIRNHPSQANYLALVPPGQHSSKSVSSTSDEFGLGSAARSGNAPFEVWWADAFVQELVGQAIELSGLSASEEVDARQLLEHAMRAADEVDQNRTLRQGAWYALSRAFSVPNLKGALSAGNAFSLACGVPPTKGGGISSRQQSGVLDKIADALSAGFGAGISKLQEGVDEEYSTALSALLEHLRSVCDRPTTFERATAAFYSPSSGRELNAPPTWWSTLNVEKWEELLVDEVEAVGDIKIHCTNALVPAAKGLPVLVEREVVLEFAATAQPPADLEITVTRAPASGEPGRVNLSAEESYVDASPPEHKSALRYTASAPNYKSGSLKVIALEAWKPGIFVTSRLAKKLTPPKRVTKRDRAAGADWVTSISLPGNGRFELLVFASSDVELEKQARLSADGDQKGGDGQERELEMRPSPNGHQLLEFEAEGNAQIDIQFRRASGGDPAEVEICRVQISCEDVVETGCRSEFERLIRWNRRNLEPSEAKAVVQLNRSARASSLQDWMLSSSLCASSFLPIVLAEDYVEKWAQPFWGDELRTILSNGKFIKDPRPSPKEFNPPLGFVEARTAIAARIRGKDDETGLSESAELGKWFSTDEAFRTDVEKYLDCYQSWLKASPDVACWVDVAIVASLDPARRTLLRTPEAILLSPLHPLRLAWHCAAQKVMLDSAESDYPCPAISVLDPDRTLDILSLAVRSPDGLDWIDFIAIENGTDYWSVLWNGARLANLPQRSKLPPFGEDFGITVGGISAGFSSAQVGRAMDDVSNLLVAKPVIAVTVGSDGNTTDACNEGLIDWCTGRYADEKGDNPIPEVGPHFVEVFDTRSESQRPDDAILANLSEDTSNRVRWYDRQPANATPDLGIIAQLDMSEASIALVENRSPIGCGGLLRHRIRRQLPDAFLSESKQSATTGSTDDMFADKVARCIATLEECNGRRVGLRFAPNVNAVSHMLTSNKADYVAVSSSAVDPACFLGDWLGGAYLWDYDLPSYSHRAGDSNGYYLISQVKEGDRDALGKALAKLPGCSALPAEGVQDVLLEVARRGIPTIRGLSGDNAGATGDLGLLVAARLLQDNFRASGAIQSLLPIVGGSDDDKIVALVIPVDPFRGYLADIQRTLRKDHKDLGFSRPDLLCIGIRITGQRVAIQLTPIEVKCRPASIFSTKDIPEALEQAKSLSRLLGHMIRSDGASKAWGIALKHLLLSFVDFGMRVYSQQLDNVGRESAWSAVHERVAAALLGSDALVEFDPRGRLIVIDSSRDSAPRDCDADGFSETIIVGRDDAGKIISDDPAELSKFYASVRAKVRDWRLIPENEEGAKSEATPDVSEKGAQATRSVAATTEGQIGSSATAQTEEAVVAPTNAAKVTPLAVEETRSPSDSEVQLSGSGVVLSVGSTVGGFQQRQLSLNISDTRLNQLNIGVVGDLGTGKTQLLKSLILQIVSSAKDNRGARPRFLIFDYKRDYSSEDFVRATGARVVTPSRLPLNLFDTRALSGSVAPWLDRFRFFADVLDKIYSGIGPVQRDKLKRAVRLAYDACSNGSEPTLYDVHREYGILLDGKSDAPMSIIDDLVDMEVFTRSASDIQTFDAFLDGVVVISLDALGQDDRSKNMLVAVMLNMFYENMLRTVKKQFIGHDPQLRAIDSYLLVDEADNIMQYEFDVLRKLLLQGREFGTGVILASQYLSHFKAGATDYREPLLTWFIHKVPNITPAELSALGLTGSPADLVEQVRSLKNHQCLYKSFDVSGEVIRGLPFFELLVRPVKA